MPVPSKWLWGDYRIAGNFGEVLAIFSYLAFNKDHQINTNCDQCMCTYQYGAKHSDHQIKNFANSREHFAKFSAHQSYLLHAIRIIIMIKLFMWNLQHTSQ